MSAHPRSPSLSSSTAPYTALSSMLLGRPHLTTNNNIDNLTPSSTPHFGPTLSAFQGDDGFNMAASGSAPNTPMKYFPEETSCPEAMITSNECVDESKGSGVTGTKNARRKITWTVGRAPWYDDSGKRQPPLFIGITGGSASGKTSVCARIVEKLNLPWVVMLSMDRFYRPLTHEEHENVGNYNFDHPDAFDFEGLVESIQKLKKGDMVRVPRYSFITHSREEATDYLYGVDVVLVEGILVLHDKRVRDLLDMKIYVNTDSDYRLIRRIKRDIVERGRTVESVLDQYEKTVKPSFEDFIDPTKKFADIIIPWNNTNTVAVDLLSEHIQSKLIQRGLQYQQHQKKLKRIASTQSMQSPLAGTGTGTGAAAPSSSSVPSDRRLSGLTSPSSTSLEAATNVSLPLLLNELPSQIFVMERTKQLIALHTLIRDRTTELEEFIFQVNRLVRMLIAEALEFVDYAPSLSTTVLKTEFAGLSMNSDVCGVSIVRSGEVFEKSLMDMIPDVLIGKIVLKQATSHKEEIGPRLYYAKVPPKVEEKKVLLMDGVLATGAAVIMAIRVLLDHGVAEENIIFCCMVAAPDGLSNVLRNFPQVKLVCSWIDDGLDQNGFVKPGLGYLGDRYYGTGKQTI